LFICLFVSFICLFPVVQGVEPRALHLLGKCATTWGTPQPSKSVFLVFSVFIVHCFYPFTSHYLYLYIFLVCVPFI
jgi:hypothetical protein